MSRLVSALILGAVLALGAGCHSGSSKSGGCACSHEGASACACGHCKGGGAACSCPK
jgi:hypothetical protein